jgi:hypothetical protein
MATSRLQVCKCATGESMTCKEYVMIVELGLTKYVDNNLGFVYSFATRSCRWDDANSLKLLGRAGQGRVRSQAPSLSTPSFQCHPQKTNGPQHSILHSLYMYISLSLWKRKRKMKFLYMEGHSFLSATRRRFWPQTKVHPSNACGQQSEKWTSWVWYNNLLKFKTFRKSMKGLYVIYLKLMKDN